jgi:hypothetical protein
MTLLHTGQVLAPPPHWRSHEVMEAIEKLWPHGVTITAFSCVNVHKLLYNHIYNSYY